MAVSLVAEDALTIGKTTHLFTVPVAGSFDVTPDGQRFLFNVEFASRANNGRIELEGSI